MNVNVTNISAATQPQTAPAAAGGTPGLYKEAGFLSSGQSEKTEQKGGNAKEVGDAVERIRPQMQSLQRNLNFSVDDSSGNVVVQVLDGDSGKVVRQIPSEDILRLAERLDEMRSLLFEAKA
ncbi:flagellar protein FlaG [Stutzerimonas nitrititolerans]|uniref:flagellar protein FlaG n=1 Tax=Stutzerimonas nitrititolerans TaxID=2482751 RepID=UPI0028B1C5F0|nr:flagellar protein FlaG [Stutzerimonas nitrititolerans]